METQTAPAKGAAGTGSRQVGQADHDRGDEAPIAAAAVDHDEHAVPRDLPKPKGWMVALMMLVLLVLMAGLFVLGWLPHHAAQEQAAADAAEVASAVPVVNVVPPIQSAATTNLVLPCDVKANQQTAIYPRTSGYLKARYVDIQDHVKTGQLLAEISTPEVDAQLAQAKVGILQAQTQLDKAGKDLQLANSTLERYHTLQKTGGPNTVTRQEVEEKENTQAQAAAAVDEAEAQVKAAEASVNRLTVLQGFEKVTAPFDGTITARNYDVGALLSAGATSPGQEMFRIAETDMLKVFVAVPQTYAGQIKIGGPAYLRANDAEYKGAVARTSDAVDPTTRTMLFELHFPNKDGKLYPGMYGTARLEITQDRPTLMIPSNALRFDAKGVRVALVENGKVHMQPVTTGRDLGTELEIVTGLKPDSEVIVNPGERLVEGTVVKVAAMEKSPAEKAAVAQKGAAGQKQASTD